MIHLEFGIEICTFDEENEPELRPRWKVAQIVQIVDNKFAQVDLLGNPGFKTEKTYDNTVNRVNPEIGPGRRNYAGAGGAGNNAAVPNAAQNNANANPVANAITLATNNAQGGGAANNGNVGAGAGAAPTDAAVATNNDTAQNGETVTASTSRRNSVDASSERRLGFSTNEECNEHYGNMTFGTLLDMGFS